MRKDILLFLLLIPCLGIAQNPCLFVCRSEAEMRRTADSIALKAKSKFVFRDMMKSKQEECKFVIHYKDTLNKESPIRMNVVFEKIMAGKNADLEIPGTPVYYLYAVEGKYLDLFPAWKTCIDPSAVLEEACKKWLNERTLKCNGQELIFRLMKADDAWRLSMIRM